MARWAGWGAGASGAGAAGASRTFLGLSLVGCAIVAVALATQGRWVGAAVSAAAAVYFALRTFAGLGKRS